jgi:lon-related putative ATP-dependent protease
LKSVRFKKEPTQEKEAMNNTKFEVPQEKLCWHCDPAVFEFEDTGDLIPLREFVGQDRAIKAIEFGLSMKHEGYNIYVAGLTGTGKTTAVKKHIDKLLAEKEATHQLEHAKDWCYVYNFSDSDRPQILAMSPGKGKVLKDQVFQLLQQLKKDLIAAFSGEEYKAERKKTLEEGQESQRKIVEQLTEEAKQQGFMLQITTKGPVLIPVVDGKPISPEEYLALDEQAQHTIDEKQAALLKKLQVAFEQAAELERQTLEKIKNMDKAVGDFTVSKLFESLLHEYSEADDVTEFLRGLKLYTLGNLDSFKETEEKEPLVLGQPVSFVAQGRDPFLPFQVNVFVDNSTTAGAPVIVEQNPNYANLFGKIERRFLFGGYLSDHTMLKPGAFHQANGGYLLLNAQDVISNPGVWPALKRTIKTQELRIEDPFEQFGLIAPQGLRPQPMPVEVKVVLIGEGLLYQMLAFYDEDFWEIFKVKADFNFEIDRTNENMVHFAAFVASSCEKCRLQHFDRTGVARIIEYASRLVSDQEKLSSRFSQIRELVQEAEYWARQDKATRVSAKHVTKAIDERMFRHNLPDERIGEMIERGVIMIDVDGDVVGQVNGLSVYTLGDISFGKPSRITCKTFLGRGGVINIEREAQLSGSIHNKGVLILSGYMGWKYAQDTPLSLSASLCFEQSYEGVEGDSASSTELYALLSSLADVPIKQYIAVTGSVNQKGEIQPIGGVNHKIEGFFRVCKAKGLTGNQGVMIPKQNTVNLMLHHDVLDAAKEGKFHIYAISTIDEGIELLTGIPAGKRGKNGAYPRGTINYKVDKQLKEMASKLKDFYGPAEEEKGEKDRRP